MIKGIIFDFDGTILDTETPEVETWEKVFRQFGFEFPLERYLGRIGNTSTNLFVHDYLREFGLNEDEIKQAVEEYHHLIETGGLLDSPREGVLAILNQVKEKELHLGIASSSIRGWVAPNLANLNLTHHFDPIFTADDVAKTKPDPALYNLVLKAWDLSPDEAIVFEDSPNGITAAKSAGIFCIAVPNPITKNMDISHADMIFDSFVDVPLHAILAELNGS